MEKQDTEFEELAREAERDIKLVWQSKLLKLIMGAVLIAVFIFGFYGYYLLR